MHGIRAWFLILVALGPGAAAGAGMARNENFIVLAPNDALAATVLRRADQLRCDVALEWLDRELPPGAGRTVINVKLSPTADRAFSWPVGESSRSFHWIWLTAPRARLLGSTLRHEITHAVLATQFSGRLPRWADEGAASLSDDPDRKNARLAMIDSYVQSAAWPDLRRVLEQTAISASDWHTYSVTASLVEYLITRRDKPTVLAFAETARDKGWDAAAQIHYGAGSLGELESGWRKWARQVCRPALTRSRHQRRDAIQPSRQSGWFGSRVTARQASPIADPSSNSLGNL